MTDDNTRSEWPDDADDADDEKTRVVDRNSDDDHTRIVSRVPVEEHTRVVERRSPAAPVAAADAGVDGAVDRADDVGDDSDETRIASSFARPEESRRKVGATADQPGMPGRFQQPEVQSGATESYGIRQVPPTTARSSRLGFASAPTVTLPASPAELREAAEARRRRRRWRTLAVAVASTLLVAAAATLGIVVLIGV